VINEFAKELPLPNIENYNSAGGPLPYLFWAIEGKIIGFDIWKLRSLSLIAACISINLFYDLCKRHALPYPLISTLFLLFFPYFFSLSFTIYTVNIGMLFGIWSLTYYLLDQNDISYMLKGSFFATLAIYCRQFYLDLPFGLLLFEFTQKFTYIRKDLFGTIRRNFWRWLVIGSPAILILPLFVLWGGLNTPDQQQGFIVQPILQQINFFPILIGFYFLPVILSPKTLNLLKSWKNVLLALVILVPIYYLFPLVYSDFTKIATASGVIVHGLDIVAKVLGNRFAGMLRFIFWLIGVTIILAEVFDFPYDDLKKKLLSFSAMFLLLMVFIPYIWERYYISAIPYTILLLHRSIDNRRVIFFSYLLLIAIIAIGYSYWQIAIK
jgi:hypothetical protein